MDVDTTRAAAESVVNSLTLLIDNDESMHSAVTAVARDAVLEDMGDPRPTVEDYRQTFNRGDTREYERVVGIAVAYHIQEMVSDDETLPEFWRMVLTDVLDLTNWAVREALGNHYLPEPSDLADSLEDEDEDEDA